MNKDIAPTHPFSPGHTLDPQGQHYEDEPSYMVPSRVNELSNQKNGHGKAISSDQDSALDYYKSADSRADSRNGATAKGQSRKKPSRKSSANWGEDESNQNNWIHRDKLKEIETRELEAAGFRIGRSSRSNSNSKSTSGGRHMSRDRTNSEATEPPSHRDHHGEHRMISPIPAEGEEEDMENTGWDIRSPEEIATDREQFAARNNILRPSTSRIPIAKTSPVPVPNTFVERDQPLPRPRNGSGSWDVDGLAIRGARVRSGSMSSQILLDSSTPVAPVSNAPSSKAKTPIKATTPASGARKATAKTPVKPRNTSANPPGKRPGTSGGISRPGTANRPEGEAPWVATMYKPDPMLPPDQQIIPTHFKRIMNEKWENEGKVASVYDRDFQMVNTEEFADKRTSRVLPAEFEQADGQWPLPSPEKLTPSNSDPAPKSPSPANDPAHKLRLTPTIPSTSRTPSRNSERRVIPPIDPIPVGTTRLPEPPAEPEKEKEKEGCCCIVM
jgi:hypothetical protein